MSFETLIATAITGCLNGGLYALLGLAIVLIFSTTGVANFAQGEIATLGAAILLLLMVQHGGLNLPLAWLSTIATVAVFGGLIYVCLIRPRARDHLNLTVRTLGLSSLLNALAVFWWGANEPYKFPTLFGVGSVQFGSASVSRDQVGTLVVAFVVATAFFCFFRYTATGLAMRAVAVNREVASLLGVNVNRMNLIAWVVAAAISAIVGLLVAPIAFLETSLMSFYILKAFTAAVIGGMRSFPGVVAGGLLLGIVESLAVAGSSPQIREPVSFAVLLLVLLLRPKGLFVSGRSRERV